MRKHLPEILAAAYERARADRDAQWREAVESERSWLLDEAHPALGALLDRLLARMDKTNSDDDTNRRESGRNED